MNYVVDIKFVMMLLEEKLYEILELVLSKLFMYVNVEIMF